MPYKLEHPFFWKLRGHPVHFLGSIHVGPIDGYALPNFVTDAFCSADVINFEVRHSGYVIPEYRILQSPDSLKTDLGSGLFSALKSHLPTVQNLERMNIEMAWYHLASSPYEILNFIPEMGIDFMLVQLIRQQSQRIYGLETESQQIDAILSECGTETATDIARYLTGGDVLRKEASAMISAFQGEDSDQLSLIRTEAFAHTPRKAKGIFPDREARWVAPIERLVSSGRRGFVAAGMLHFAEPDGLLSRLRGKGYEFDRVRT